ncbi:hypothetical protein BSKO_12845 [Bryopsis sp. KO-2023]|nr:hypothetical protein BSKO_12845 [Bryopsis sp. KO-2023]
MTDVGSPLKTDASQSTKEKLEAASVPTIQDLKIENEVFREVNAHLNGQIERSTYEIDNLRAELGAWKSRAKVLVRALDKLKQKGVNVASDEEGNCNPLLDTIFPAEEGPDDADLSAICDEICEVDGESTSLEGVDLEGLVARGKTGGWIVEPEEVILGETIGEGAFGTTYMASWRGADVAVKAVKIKGREDLVSFLREVEALAALRHPNVLPFFAACIKPPDKYWLICEFMTGGTLSKWVHGGTRRGVVEKLQMALEVAQGMQACEGCSPPIIHRDLKPSNVFIDGSGCARLGDFGLARRLLPDSQATLTSETGTYVYMSPEMIRHEVYSLKTDVWSWGVMLCEMLTQTLPYTGQFLTPIQIAVAVSHGKVKPTIPQDVHPGISMLLDLCLMMEPEQRPTFAMIASQMTVIVKEVKGEMLKGTQSESFIQRLFSKTREVRPSSRQSSHQGENNRAD